VTLKRASWLSRRKASRLDKGQSTVEFALVLPFIFLLLLALLQAGVMLRDQLIVAAAAREGAREAAVSPEPEKVEKAVRRAAAGLDVTVKLSRGPRRGDLARVEVSAKPTTLPIVGGIASGRKLTSSAVMRVEQASR
jgi:hypothetical protein